ncbi:MAG: sigma-54 dependent transcriptional regulator [Pseudomonadota bacterium]
MPRSILIVDDEPVQRRLLENVVNKIGFRAVTAEDGEQALELLANAEKDQVAAVILDLVMPGLDGMGVLERMRDMNAAPPVIVQTAQGGIDTVVSAIRAGAADFCVKPVSFERLKISIENALKMNAMEDAVRKIQKSASGHFTFDDMIANSEQMSRVTSLGKRAAGSKIPVLIEGESGVGKEVIARAIQGTSDRKGKPFITVNCGALPENLVESILFGHEKGAFTGANSSHIGKFKEVDGGTLFLDEVGELTPDIQVKLLRAIQEGEIDPVGAKRPVRTDFRLISATNRNMIEMVTSGRFREDLYYRLNVFPIMVPPLRKRRQDIAPLVRHFTARLSLEEGRRKISGIHRDALELLENHDWPGNVRQLENTLFRAIILCEGDELTVDHFPQISSSTQPDAIAHDAHSHPRPGLTGAPTMIAPPLETVVHFDTMDSHSPDPAIVGNSQSASKDMVTMLNHSGTIRPLDEIEKSAIEFAIDHHNGRMTRVAKSLGIGRSTLYRKLKEYGLDQTRDEMEQTSG